MDPVRKWRVQIGPERVEVVASPDGWVSDCAVEASASDLLLLLWNRVGSAELDVTGDPDLLASWRELVLVQWTD